MSTHNICFYGEITKIIPKLSSYTHLYLFYWFSDAYSTDSSNIIKFGVPHSVFLMAKTGQHWCSKCAQKK